MVVAEFTLATVPTSPVQFSKICPSSAEAARVTIVSVINVNAPVPGLLTEPPVLLITTSIQNNDVGVGVGVGIGVGVGAGVGVMVAVGSGVVVGSAVGAGVAVGPGVGVGSSAGVAVAVGPGVGAGVGVGIGKGSDGRPPDSTIVS